MKRVMTALLTVCLVCQSWIGSSIPAYGAELPEIGGMAAEAQDGGAGQGEAGADADRTDAPGAQTPDAAEGNADGESALGVSDAGKESAQIEGTEEKTAAEKADGNRMAEIEPDTYAGDMPGTPSGAEGDGALAQAEGAIEIEVRKSASFSFQEPVKVQAAGSSQEPVAQVLDFTEGDAKTARFELAPGTYQISVQAKGFADYTQYLTVEEDSVSKVKVGTNRFSIDKFAYGWLRPGDVNGDGEISQDDTKAILDAIRNDPQGTDCDVNGDGITDIADLQLAVQSLEEGQEATPEVQKNIRAKQAQATEGTILEGSVEDLLAHAGSVGLKPADPEAEISPENPVGLEFALAEDGADPAAIPMLGGMTIYAPLEIEDGEDISSAITDGEATVVYVDEAGSDQELKVPLSVSSAQAYAAGSQSGIAMNVKAAPRAQAPAVTAEPDGSLILNFGTQIAVKRVTISITGTKKTEPLVNIAKVEFVNDMESRIPAPQLDIPTLNAPVSGDKSLTVSWNRQVNVTGYEVYVSGPVKGQSGNASQIVRVSNTQHIISNISDKSLMNFEKYTIKVRSVNGDWCSPWSNEQVGEPKPTKLPAAVDNVKVVGGYRSISVSWKDMDDSNGYMVYYKKYDDPDTAFRPVVDGFQETKEGTGKIDGARYTIAGLEDRVKYAVYVKGWNELGWGSPSLRGVAETTEVALPQLPKYKLLNTSNGEGKLTNHIVAAAYGGSGGAHMEGSPLDTENKSALGLVDDDYGSYWVKTDWDDGVSYPAGDKGVTVTLDQEYQINYITFAAVDTPGNVNRVRVGYYDAANPSKEQSVGARSIRKTDEYGNPYFIVKFDTTVTANKIRLCIGYSLSYTRLLKIGEIHFHQYDSLEDEIMSLYMDEMHTTLRKDVTEKTIQALEGRLETVDEQSGEKHPLYNELKLELETAREILNSNLAPSFVVDNQITARKDTHLGFGGLNAWQPLGKVAYAGETLLVYVGHNTKRTGDSADLQLVFTQYHSESSALARTQSLKVGRNEITVPAVSTNDFERGGQLYVAYTGNNASDKYAVRISGASNIPSLIVNGKTGTERTEAIQAYVEDLENYVGAIEDTHNKKHTDTPNVDYAYDQTNCILNATDIMMDQMMYSLPATQIWAGLASASDKVDKLDKALKAMEDTMTLFYHHKGLSDSAGTARGNNALPSQHLNIRYMRMFAGAFMYAAGNHIGIEWGSSRLSAVSGMNGFGWGIAHEIGHDINQGSYAVAEITNNYFSQLLTGTQRYTYTNVYKKVTSGTIGRASNVFTQLALYWQLHLAYDDNKDDHHIYETYDDQFNNLFFARVDTYSRNPAKAPQAGLALNGGTDQNLMRLACAAANKNILPFFERWGMVPDEATIAYAAKYGEPEEKALYYVNPQAREYRLDHPETEEATIKGKGEVVTATATASSNQVSIDIQTNQEKELILGYEISRSMISNGKKETKVVGFVPIEETNSTVYVDTVTAINNRVMSYEVRAVDKYLNYSDASDAGAVKIQTEGILDKSDWTIETTMVSDDDIEINPDEDDPDSGYSENGSVPQKKVNSIERILDNDKATAYQGTCTGSATITVDLHRIEQVTALKYLGDALKQVTVEVSQDGTEWTEAKKDYAGLDGTEEKTIWLDSIDENGETRGDFIGTYDARYVRLTVTPAEAGAQAEDGQEGDVSGASISIQEIEICGPSGDNLEFMASSDGKPAIGVLSADYKYGKQDADVIPKGSLVFTGTYKGNPAYNVVILYDTEGNVIGAKEGDTIYDDEGNAIGKEEGEVHAAQVIFADVPEHGELGETSNGTWVYYVEPGHWDEDTLSKIKGVRGELYRVDNALTLEGERIVSDTQVIEIPKVLPEITLEGKIPD